jgi:4-diphosphocytidyl-2-C-methyl-D-erythritol kinase
MVVFPPAKINLGLNILRKRADGFHDLSTCFYAVPWCDILELLSSSQLRFVPSGIPVPGREEDNLCLKAYHLVKKDFDIAPVDIYLHKILPMGAGLGGGSSDGAWTLRALNELFKLNLDKDKLKQYAAQLGSDCAFFIEDSPMIGTGRGEILEPVNVSLKGNWMMIVKPDIHVSTKDAFAGVQPNEDVADLRSILAWPVHEWRDSLTNDFERSVFSKYPAIESIKSRLYEAGALYASMSGSGSAVYGIFENKPKVSSELEVHKVWTGRMH